MQESIHVFLQIMQVSLGEESTTPCHYSTSAKEEIIIFTNTAILIHVVLPRSYSVLKKRPSALSFFTVAQRETVPESRREYQ